MSRADHSDPVWELAWRWLIREHEGPLDETSRQQLEVWLKADAKHRSAYEEACEIWVAAALVPRVGTSGHDTSNGNPAGVGASEEPDH